MIATSSPSEVMLPALMIASLNPDELKVFVSRVREAELALGSDSFEMSEEEYRYRNLLKKSIYSKKEIKAGELITSESLCFKRSLEDDRILVDQLEKVIGSTASTDIQANTRITWQIVQEK